MTEGKHVENADRLKRPGPLLVSVDFLLERPQVGADIAVTVDHALGTGGRSGGVDNLNDVRGRNILQKERAAF